jgi:hypothetical protein
MIDHYGRIQKNAAKHAHYLLAAFFDNPRQLLAFLGA